MNPFNPSRDDVRRFFASAWQKTRDGAPATPLETLAGEWVREHPEYHAILAVDANELAEVATAPGEANPFLHLSMHLSISEQVSIDQPPGIRAAAEGVWRELFVCGSWDHGDDRIGVWVTVCQDHRRPGATF